MHEIFPSERPKVNSCKIASSKRLALTIGKIASYCALISASVIVLEATGVSVGVVVADPPVSTGVDGVASLIFFPLLVEIKRFLYFNYYMKFYMNYNEL